MLLTKSQILKGSSLKRELVSVPEWHEGGEVYVRTMTGQERDIFDQKMKDNSEDESMLEFRALLCASTVCGDDDALLFSEKDIKELNKKSSVPLIRIMMTATKLNPINEEDVEALAKNS